MEPRKPTIEEKNELVEYLVKEGQIEAPEPDEDLFNGTIFAAVFDNYMTDGPGYDGKVMVVVWSGSPAFTETYYWQRPILPEDKGKLMGQIDWHDGKHEPKIDKVVIEETFILASEGIDKQIDAMISEFEEEILRIYDTGLWSTNTFTTARLQLRSKIIELKLQSQDKNIKKAA